MSDRDLGWWLAAAALMALAGFGWWSYEDARCRTIGADWGAWHRTPGVWLRGRPRDRISDLDIDPVCVRRLNAVIARSGCKVVISSTWRLLYSRAALVRLLVRRGLEHPDAIIGITPDGNDHEVPPDWRPCERGTEIAMWRSEHQHSGPFAVLDDNSDMTDVWDAFVQTSDVTGVDDDDVERVVALLRAV